MECFKAFHIYITLENLFQIIIFEKVIFYDLLGLPSYEKSNILGHNFWLVFSNVMNFGAYERYSTSPPSIKISAWNMEISSHTYLPKISIQPKNAVRSFRG